VNVLITVTVAEGGTGETARAVAQSTQLSIHGCSVEERRTMLADKLGEAGADVLGTFLDCVEAEEAEPVDPAS
jgi:hypothetical protein